MENKEDENSQNNTQIRHVQSHPSMAPSPPPPGSRSLGSLPFSATLVPNSNGSMTSNLSSHSSVTTKPKISPENRSPIICNSTDDNEDIEEDHDGAHDTITSLAGAKMLQRYRRAISGSHKGSASSLNQQNRLEDLFLIEEDAKDIEEEEPESPLEAETKYPITAEIFVPPDGDYGWLIALGAFNALFWTAGLVKSYGVIFDMILKTFPESSVTLAAWIPASMTTLALAMAPFASALCQRFNCRTVTFIGSLFCFIGITSSAFAMNVETLFLTFGLLTGLGIGLSTTPGIILVARYFDKRRGIANAFCLSGTAAGSLCLPFLIEILVRTYAFKGTLLILGACMLHISISAAVYRPLAVHVQITKKHRNVVQLHEASHGEITVQNQQATINKEPTDFHVKKLQSTCHHSVPYDPDDIVAKLQTKLTALDNEVEQELREDSISINSSVSQDKHHHHHHHHHHHVQHSGHGTPKHRQYFHSGQQTPLHNYHSGQHTPNARGPLGFRHSFASMAVSLPPGLEYQEQKILTPTNSSLASREDLQCNWHELPKFDIEPVETTEMIERRKARVEEEKVNLSSLFLHQVGRKINQYKAIFVGNNKKHMSNVASFVSVGNAAAKADPSPSVSRQHSTKRPIDPEKPRNIPRRSSSMRYRSSLMFTFEDMTTDSTSVLKDFRHPSLSSVNVTTAEPGPKLGRVISLNRSVSSAAQSQRRRSSCKVPKRQRYMSEGHDKGDNIYDSKLFICTHNKEKGSGSSLCVSMDLGLAGAPTPLLFDKVDTDGGTESKNEEKRVQTFLQDISKYLDLKLVQEPIFLMMVWSVMAMSVGVPHVLFFVPTYVRSLPVSVDPAVLLSVTSVADLLGRIAFGFLLDSNLLPKHLMYGVMILAAGLSVIVLSFASTPALLIISMLVYGLGSGAWFLMVPLLLAEYLGVERIGSSYGLIRLFQALSNLVGPVVGGVLSDHTGSFSASFIVMGLVMSCGATLVFFKPIIEKKSLEKKIQAVPSDKQDQS